MSDDLVKRLRTEPNWMREDYPQSEAADRIEAQAARIAELEAALGHATEYVGRLALTLAGKHYPDQKRFELLPDLLGRIDQIDNMTCGLARAALAGGKKDEATPSA